MAIWIVTVCVLFVLVQLVQWVQGFMLPLPVYVLAGAFLAVASNYEKGLGGLVKQIQDKQDTHVGSELGDRSSQLKDF